MYLRASTGEDLDGFVLDCVGAHELGDLAERLRRHPKIGMLAEGIASHLEAEDLPVWEGMETSVVFQGVVDHFVEQFCYEGFEDEVVSMLRATFEESVTAAIQARTASASPGM
jgi:hypothetical protein